MTPIAVPTANRNRGTWNWVALGVLALGALFNAWDWLAQDRMPGADFPGYAARIQYVRDALLEHGRVPAWCVECDGGTTNFTGSLKETLAFPLALLFEPVLATKLAFLIWKIAAGWLLYALIARYLAAPRAGIIAGYSLAFGEIANHQIEHLDGVLALAILSALVIAGVELLRRGGIGWIAALGVLAACHFVNNGVHALLLPPALILLVLVRPGLCEDANPWRDRALAARWARRIAAASAVALLFAGGQIAWIALDAGNHRLFRQPERKASREWAIERSPFLFVNRDNALAPWLETHHPPDLDVAATDGGRRYVGVVWIAVCAIGVLAMRGARQWDLRRWAAVASLMLWLHYWLALGPHTLLWEIATSLQWSPEAEARIRTGLAIASGSCLVLASALGLRAWRLRGAARWVPVRRAVLASALLAFPIFSLWSACRDVIPMLEQQRSPGRFSDLAPFWLYLLFAVALVAIERRIARPRVAAALLALIAALVVLDFAPSRRQYANGVEMASLRPAVAMLDSRPAEGGTLRVGPGLPSDPLASWLIGQSSLGNACTWLAWQANPYWHRMVLNALYPLDLRPSRADEHMDPEPDVALLRAARIRYLLWMADKPLHEPLRRVAEHGDFALWELPEVAPVVRVYRRFVLVRGDSSAPGVVSQALKADVIAILLPNSAPLAAALGRVARSYPSRNGTFPRAPAPIEARSRRLTFDRIAIEIDEGPEPAMVSISEAYHPWWHARVDGHPVPIVRANLALMAVAIDRGAHQIELRFERPALLAIADGLTAVAWIALFVGAPIGWLIGSRRDALR